MSHLSNICKSTVAKDDTVYQAVNYALACRADGTGTWLLHRRDGLNLPSNPIAAWATENILNALEYGFGDNPDAIY